MGTAIRLQKYLASRGVCSRRRAEDLIQAGQVQVNGATITQLGTTVDPDQDEVHVAGQPLPILQLRYYLLHKPVGVISTCQDPWGRPTVLGLVPAKVHPVGRLDQDSSGALILTNDGALTQKLTHPSHECWKVYQVWVQGRPTASVLSQWRNGVRLEDKLTLPAHVQVLSTRPGQTRLEIHLREGRNRQIRRIAQQLGYPVESLTRTAIGPVQLGALAPGAYRLLTRAEVQQLDGAPIPVRRAHE